MNQSILILAAYGAPYEGNFIPSIRMLSRTLKEQNIDTVLILQKRVEKYDWVQKLDWCSEVLFISDSIASDVSKIAVLMKRHHFLFAHTHFAESKHIAMLKLAMLLSLQKFPIVEHHHNHFPIPANPIKKAVKFALIGSDYLVGCSKGVAESLMNANLKNDVDYIENALDFRRLNYNEACNRGQNVMMLGFDFKRKGIDIALEAFSRITKDFPDAKLKICVAVNLEGLKEQCRSYLGTIPSWLEFLPPLENIAEYYSHSRLFLSASREEGFCYALVEAAYCGCLVASSRVDGPAQIKIKDIQWFPPEDVATLEATLRMLLSFDSEEVSAMTQRLKADAIANYDVTRWIQGMMDYYRKKELIP